MCLNPVGAPVEWCCQFASTLFPGDEDECSPSDTFPVPTPRELGIQLSLAGTIFPVVSGNDWPEPFPCWPGPHLTGLSLLAQTSGRHIPAVAVTLLSKGLQVGGDIGSHTASVETATPQCSLLSLCSHGEFCFSGSHCQ